MGVAVKTLMDALELLPTVQPITALVAGQDYGLIQASVQPLADANIVSVIRHSGGAIRRVISEHTPSIIITSIDFYQRRLERLLESADGPSHIPPVLIYVSLSELETANLRECGTDVVIVPCSAAEMELRIKRTSAVSMPASNSSLLRVGEITLNVDSFRVAVDGKPQQLSWMEYQLLKLLMENFGRVLTREHILGTVWATDHFGGTRTVDVHISRLRFKLGPKASEHFRTVKNVGYGLV